MWYPSVVPQVPDVLRRLRQLRGDLEYYVEQDGWILLLAWDPTKPRVREAHKMLELKLNTFDNLIMADGFSILAMLPPSAVWSGELLQVAQNIIDNATPKKVEQVHHERFLEADGTMADIRGEAHMRDALESDFRSDHRILFRGRHSVSGDSRRRAQREVAEERARLRRVADEFQTAAALLRRHPNIPILTR